MKVLLIVAIVLVAIWLLIKILIKTVPVILRFLLYNVVAIPVWIILIFVPNRIFAGFLATYLLYRAIVKSWKLDLPVIADIFPKKRRRTYVGGYSGGGYSGGSYSGGGYSSSGYVLNKKSGVIHDAWDSSADTISEHHKRYISYSEALELVGRGGRYHFKGETD